MTPFKRSQSASFKTPVQKTSVKSADIAEGIKSKQNYPPEVKIFMTTAPNHNLAQKRM